MGCVVNQQALANARNAKETREEIRCRESAFRMITTPVYQEGKQAEIIQLGTHLRFVKKNLTHFKSNLLAALPIILILGSFGGWVLARRSLAPIGYIASKAESISSQNLSERLTPRGTGDEMDELIRTTNEMISRLEGSLDEWLSLLRMPLMN